MSKTVSEIRLDRKAHLSTSLTSGIGCAGELEPAKHGNVGNAAIARLRSVVQTPYFASSFRLREASSGKPGGYVGQAVNAGNDPCQRGLRRGEL